MLPPEPKREKQAASTPRQPVGESPGAFASGRAAPLHAADQATSPPSPGAEGQSTPTDGPTCTINVSSLPSLLREDIEDAPFWKEVVAFAHLPHPEVEKFDGQYVAVYNSNIVDSDPDEGELALRFYRTFGYVPVYIHFVGVEDAVIDVYD